MTTFGNASTYTGPFESLYEEHEAMQGNRGNQASHMAAQAQHSRGLQAKGLQDTSVFGTNKDILGNNQYENPADNPLNVLMDFQGPAAAAQMEASALSLEDPAYGASSPQGLPLMSVAAMNPSSSMYPSLFGGSDLISSSPEAKTGIGQFFTDVSDAYRKGRQDLGMGVANLFSGGAFIDDMEAKIQRLKDFGYSDAAARDYVIRTQQQAQRQQLSGALYGMDSGTGPGIDTSKPAGDVGVLDPEGPEQPEDPITRIPAIHIAPIRMAQGGLMSLRRR